ncbi:Hypothetical_protein [Hexamita inflata]|uniref:Hypothetical_protein n=1 Tax=Hexamita inflata TaxID=28002 RepID=A0AA86UV29_9EUKA|nr:Hypothetical protein HINF_LOCUS60555 [Hexamita inflata]
MNKKQLYKRLYTEQGKTDLQNIQYMYQNTEFAISQLWLLVEWVSPQSFTPIFQLTETFMQDFKLTYERQVQLTVPYIDSLIKYGNITNESQVIQELNKSSQYISSLQTTFDAFVEQIKQYMNNNESRQTVINQFAEDYTKLQRNLDTMLTSLGECIQYSLVQKNETNITRLNMTIEKVNKVLWSPSQL